MPDWHSYNCARNLIKTVPLYPQFVPLFQIGQVAIKWGNMEENVIVIISLQTGS